MKQTPEVWNTLTHEQRVDILEIAGIDVTKRLIDDTRWEFLSPYYRERAMLVGWEHAVSIEPVTFEPQPYLGHGPRYNVRKGGV